MTDYRDETYRWERAWRLADDPLAPRWHRQAARLIWGIVSIVPLALTMTMIASDTTRTGAGLSVLTLLWTGFVVIMMAGFVMSSSRMPWLGKAAWILSFLFFAPLALPLYWLRHIWDAPLLEPQPVRVRPVLRGQTNRY